MLMSTRWRESAYSGQGSGNCVEVASWRKSSHSGGGDGQCVEIGSWRKSSRSGGSQGQCVEVGTGASVFGVRDTKDRDGGMLLFDAPSWKSFAAAVKAGCFDL